MIRPAYMSLPSPNMPCPAEVSFYFFAFIYLYIYIYISLFWSLFYIRALILNFGKWEEIEEENFFGSCNRHKWSVFEVNFDKSRTFAEVCTSLHLRSLFYICGSVAKCQLCFYRWGHFFENPLPVLVLLKLEISPNCIPRHRELGPCSDKTWQNYILHKNHNYQNTDHKGWGLSAKLGKHSAIWGKLGTALQAYTLSPCTKFPPNPTSRKVNT